MVDLERHINLGYYSDRLPEATNLLMKPLGAAAAAATTVAWHAGGNPATAESTELATVISLLFLYDICRVYCAVICCYCDCRGDLGRAAGSA